MRKDIIERFWRVSFFIRRIDNLSNIRIVIVPQDKDDSCTCVTHIEFRPDGSINRKVIDGFFVVPVTFDMTVFESKLIIAWFISRKAVMEHVSIRNIKRVMEFFVSPAINTNIQRRMLFDMEIVSIRIKINVE